MEDRFDYFQNRDDDDTTKAITRQVVEETAMSTSACLVLIQVEFSDFPETHMSLVESDPLSGADYWEFDPSSSLSTPYQGLPFSIKQLTLRGNR